MQSTLSLLTALLLAPLGVLPAAQPAVAGEGDRTLSVQQLRDLAGTNHWAVYSNNPVLRPGAKGEWDAGALGSMTVLKVRGSNVLFLLSAGLLAA